ncbi:MAG: NYN domain-containing protein [Spirochaetales bacterium]|nr:NYN domain-containing protein [Spirochaetales bacterium]
MKNSTKKLAVIIDADNAQAGAIEGLLQEIARFGISFVRKAYGDWTTSNLNGWKDVLHRFAIQPVQQFGYTKGKNSTDASMIIDAMDMLYSKNYDGFCIVSSDSDFTRLATRIRQEGLSVYGFGERKTPEAFIAACDAFVYVENILDHKKQSVSPSEKEKLQTIICRAIDSVSADDGWAALSAVGHHIMKNNPDFDARNYGHLKLGKLVEDLDYIDVEHRPDKNSRIIHIFIRSH